MCPMGNLWQFPPAKQNPGGPDRYKSDNNTMPLHHVYLRTHYCTTGTTHIIAQHRIHHNKCKYKHKGKMDIKHKIHHNKFKIHQKRYKIHHKKYQMYHQHNTKIPKKVQSAFLTVKSEGMHETVGQSCVQCALSSAVLY